jgi:LacI family transcriptional regulator
MSLGHRDIGFIAGPRSLSSARRRKQAFQATLRKCGLRQHNEWTVVGDMRVEGGSRAMEEILAGATRPTALVATNDLMANGAIETARKTGVRIPSDISLLGFDDLPLSSLVFPKLSTIHLSRQEIALRAFSGLMEATKSGNKVIPQGVPIRPRLIVRESTGKPSSI